MKVSKLLLLAIIVLLAIGAQASTNLITNGNFATGDFSGWTVVQTNGDGFPVQIVALNTGCCFGEFVPNDNLTVGSPDLGAGFAPYFVSDLASQSLSQDVFLTPGLYQIGFDAYIPFNGLNNVGDGTFSAELAGVTLVNQGIRGMGAGGWFHFSGNSFISAAGTYSAEFAYNTNFVPSDDILVDRVYVVPTTAPEPGSLAMLGTGLVSFLGFVRRKIR